MNKFKNWTVEKICKILKKTKIKLVLNYLTMSTFFSFITHHKSSIIGIIGAIQMYLLSKGYISMDEATLVANVLAVFGVTVNLTLPRK